MLRLTPNPPLRLLTNARFHATHGPPGTAVGSNSTQNPHDHFLVPAAPPSFDIVAKIAYLNYLERAERGLPGDEQGDWLAAEQSLQGERSPQLT